MNPTPKSRTASLDIAPFENAAASTPSKSEPIRLTPRVAHGNAVPALNEPIAQYGPFVMNTRDEIEQAIQDYNSGNLTAA